MCNKTAFVICNQVASFSILKIASTSWKIKMSSPLWRNHLIPGMKILMQINMNFNYQSDFKWLVIESKECTCTSSLRSPVEAEDVGTVSCVSRQVGELEAAGRWRGRALAWAIINWLTLSMSPAWSIRDSSFQSEGASSFVGGNPSDRCYLLPVCIQTEIKGCLVASLWRQTIDRSPRCPLAPVPAWRFILQPISHLARILQG